MGPIEKEAAVQGVREGETDAMTDIEKRLEEIKAECEPWNDPDVPE